MAGGGGRALHEAISAPDEEHEAEYNGDNGECHTN